MTIYVPTGEDDIDVVMSFVSFDEFQVRYENTIPAADEERVGALLDDACALAADITGTTYAVVDNVAPEVPGAITATVCTVVRRAYENPLGLGGETIGDYSWRVSAGSDAGVYFTPTEKQTMRLAAGKSSVGTLELQGMLPAVDAAQFVTVAGSNEPVPWFAYEDLL